MSDEKENSPAAATDTEKALKGRQTQPKVKPAPTPKPENKPVEPAPAQERDVIDEALSIFGWGND